MEVLEQLSAYGGVWLVILTVLILVVRSTTSAADSSDSRFVATVTRPEYRWGAAAIAGAAVLTGFSSLWHGRAFLPAAAEHPWLPTAYGLLATAAITLSLVSYRLLPTRQRAVSYRTLLPVLLVALCIVAANLILEPAPHTLWQQPDEAHAAAITYVQQRLLVLGCFDPDDGLKRPDGVFDPRTAAAVSLFQLRNDLLVERQNDWPYAGKVRRQPELSLLTNPFPWLPWLDKPRPCTGASKDDGAEPGG